MNQEWKKKYLVVVAPDLTRRVSRGLISIKFLSAAYDIPRELFERHSRDVT